MNEIVKDIYTMILSSNIDCYCKQCEKEDFLLAAQCIERLIEDALVARMD